MILKALQRRILAGIHFSVPSALIPSKVVCAECKSNIGAALKVDDRQAFVTQIATKHGMRLRRYLAARVRNAADVSDLVQEVFLRLLRVDRHESIRNPEAYVMTVASHVLHQHTLRSAAAPELSSAPDTLVDPIETDLWSQVDAQRRLQAMDRTLESLALNVQATFVLHLRDGMTLEEIAEQLGVSRAMVKKYLAKAALLCTVQPESAG